MKHGYGCGCPNCVEAHPHAFDRVNEPVVTQKNLTDLQAALRKACEQIANELGAAEMLSGPCMDAARIIERHLSPVVLAAEAAAKEQPKR